MTMTCGDFKLREVDKKTLWFCQTWGQNPEFSHLAKSPALRFFYHPGISNLGKMAKAREMIQLVKHLP